MGSLQLMSKLPDLPQRCRISFLPTVLLPEELGLMGQHRVQALQDKSRLVEPNIECQEVTDKTRIAESLPP